MKHSIPMWVALTFLMLFLVLVAACFFLIQGRYRMQDEIVALQAQVAESDATLGEIVLNATLTAKQAADAEATRSYAAGQAQVAQLEQATATTMSAQATSAVDAAQSAIANQAPPMVEFVSPADATTIVAGEPLELIVSAADANGLISIELLVDGAGLETVSAADETLFTTNYSWQPTEVGSYIFDAFAINTMGRASDIVRLTVNVIEPTPAPTEVVATEVVAAAATPIPPTPTPTIIPTEPAPIAVLTGNEFIDNITRNVIELRGLAPTEPITLTLLTEDELRAEIETIVAEDLTEDDARNDVIELYAFDFVAPDFDLYGVLTDLLSDSILGYYDPETAELVVVSDDDEIDPYEQLTLAHEIVHALQDQAFDLGQEGANSEADFALRALAEGDATLLQTLYLTGGYFSDSELAQLFGAITAEDSIELDGIPQLIIDQQSFPYVEGTNFVQMLYEQGGFAAVNAAWANPPVSTEQILHPERYLEGDAPILTSLVPLTDTLGIGWELIADDVLGEFALIEYLEQRVSPVSARRAGEGWGGDSYAVYWNEGTEEVVMVLRSFWDSAEDREEFALVLADYAAAKYQVDSQAQVNRSDCWVGADVLCIWERGGETRVVRAPTLDIAIAIYGELGGG